MLTETEDSDRYKKDFKVFQFWIPVLEQAAILLLSEWLQKNWFELIICLLGLLAEYWSHTHFWPFSVEELTW